VRAKEVYAWCLEVESGGKSYPRSAGLSDDPLIFPDPDSLIRRSSGRAKRAAPDETAPCPGNAPTTVGDVK